ncbi:glycoside hydrolase family 6 protein [Dactylosporangium sp. NPDC050688]|uniref:glycoside hydrolase family 6 protein n=1 Tax=Dactylosporangium sp. NPDC050688 TaxID=3157217 RepID=UPI00340EFBE7
MSTAALQRSWALPVLVAYNIPDRGCTDFEQGAPTGEAYEQRIDQLVLALGDERAAIIMEPDAIAADCFDDARAAHLRRGRRAAVRRHPPAGAGTATGRRRALSRSRPSTL